MTQGEPPPAYILWSKIKINLQGHLQGQLQGLLPGRFYALKNDIVISQKYPPL